MNSIKGSFGIAVDFVDTLNRIRLIGVFVYTSEISGYVIRRRL